MKVLKKDGTLDSFKEQKIMNACYLAAQRALVTLSNEDYNNICNNVLVCIDESDYFVEEYGEEIIPVEDMHAIVENVLTKLQPSVAQAYIQYRNYKKSFVKMMDEVYSKEQVQRYVGDVSNANTDSTMVSTQRSLSYGLLSKELYKNFFLNKEELQASNDGYIYIHDMKDRRDSVNCCLFDVNNVLTGGFELGNIWYNEPKTLDVAFDVIGDITLSAASQQYGGFTIPRVDSILAPYAEKSFNIYYNEYLDIKGREEKYFEEAEEWATKKVRKEFEQGFQGWEYKFNTVASSRGDYPFISISFGLDTSIWGSMASEIALEVRKNGQGKKGFKKPVLFPKLTFLYDENLHGEGKQLEWLFEKGIDCSCACMYPDWLSLTGEGYIPSIYKKYGQVISLMGCRASLSPWYERGGMHPADENDQPIFEGRCNLGAISLHLPMILAKSRQENKDFYKVLDYYLELIRNLHKRTYAFLGEKRASTNPLAFMQGGFLGGTLNANDKIKSILPPMTMSFGITALNELQHLYNGKNLVEDNTFALEVMHYINDYVNRIKEEDHILYAIYGTPAESLCFSGDTLVQTMDGNKPIKDVTVNDLVYSFNEKTKKIELKPVVNSMCTSLSAKVVKVNFTNGQSVVCTPNHKFATRVMVQDENGRFIREEIKYVEAQNLKKGQRIKSNYITINADGHYKCTTDQYIHDINAEYYSFANHKVESVEYLEETIPVYDITVEDNHNFYIGGNDGILVHNCGLQVEQFRAKYGIIEGVSDKPYVSNSFHCHVSEQISPILKQDKEGEFWDLFNGGKIQYCRYKLGYNREAVKTLILRAMKKGFYEGVNLDLCYCEDCGHQQVEMDFCPKCGSKNITKIDRMNGYLGYTRVKGKTRYNEAKNAEIKDRVSM